MMMVIGGGPAKGGDEEKPSFGKYGKSEDGDGGSSLIGMGRKRYAKDILRALGIDPADVDVGAFDKALYAYMEACQGMGKNE